MEQSVAEYKFKWCDIDYVVRIYENRSTMRMRKVESVCVREKERESETGEMRGLDGVKGKGKKTVVCLR